MDDDPIDSTTLVKCCRAPDHEHNKDIGVFCNNCFAIVDPMIIDDVQVRVTNPYKSYRFKKFKDMIVISEMPWYVKETLIDMFKCVEETFHKSNSSRKNFVHMGQLSIELLNIAGYPQYADNFKSIKTDKRSIIVKEFVISCFESGLRLQERLPRIEELEYLEPKAIALSNLSKVVNDNHIFVSH